MTESIPLILLSAYLSFSSMKISKTAQRSIIPSDAMNESRQLELVRLKDSESKIELPTSAELNAKITESTSSTLACWEAARGETVGGGRSKIDESAIEGIACRDDLIETVDTSP